MLQHMLMFYKYGGKQLYYFNTHDGQGELDVNKLVGEETLQELESAPVEDEYCETCVI